MTGFHSIAKALRTICTELGVQFRYNSAVDEILVEGKVYDYKVTRT
jgi:phytoene dehydrogenase-like protein